MRKRSKRILIVMAVFVALLVTGYAIGLARAKAGLRQAYAALAQDGRPMNAAELIPPAVTDEQNGAPLYEKAASLLKAQPMGRRNLLEYLGDRSSRFVAGSLDAEDLAEFRQLMGQPVVSSALELAEQGALRPACQPKRDYRSDPLKDVPILADMRNLARLLGARAYFEAQANSPEKAWDMALTQLRMAKALRADPLCEGQRSHESMIRSSCSTIQRLCEVGPASKDTYQEIEALLGGLDLTTGLVRALDGDRLLRGEWLFNLPEDQLRQALLRGPVGNGSRLFACVAAFGPRFVADHTTYLQTLHMCTRWVTRPYSVQDPETSMQIRDLASSRFLTRDLVSAAFLCKEWLYRTIADVGITRAGLGVLQYRQEHGTFPQTLEATGLKGLIDPYTQGVLCYRAEGEGFVVYSTGEDLKDNGGIPRQRDQKTDYDQVWRFPSPK